MIHINTSQTANTVLGILDVILWSLRKSPRDVVAMYEALSPLMCHVARTRMLNFGYWDRSHDTPALAQENMCDVMANVAELDSVQNGAVLDVGSGLGGPAAHWTCRYPGLRVCCVNTSHKQLCESYLHAGSPLPAAISDATDCMPGIDGAGMRCDNNADNGPAGGKLRGLANTHAGTAPGSAGMCGRQNEPVHHVNASAVALPFADSSVMRVISLESAQHFDPLTDFIRESGRVLAPGGVLAIAIPVVLGRFSSARLGMLNFTWASEHYRLQHVLDVICGAGFEIMHRQSIGDSVYPPLADYYAANRDEIRQQIGQLDYPSYVEHMIAISMRKMQHASDAKMIDYVVLKCMAS